MKVVLITGCSTGIGLATAKQFSQGDYQVIATARNPKSSDELIELGRKENVLLKELDVCEQESVDSLFDELSDFEIDVLVNNAGAAWGADFDNFPENGWDKVMDTNVKSIFFLTQKFVKLLEKSGTNSDPSRVINVGSIDGIGIPRAETYSYPASKAAVHQLTRVLANRLAERNININAIAPGPFQSQMMNETLKKYEKEIITSVPRKRIGVPEDMAGAAIFLSSKASAYITGIVLPVDGGSLIARRHMV